jgi:Holliday junction resolvase RusA-like endonuclease
MIVMDFDVCPIGKGRPKFGNGHTYTPQKTREFEDEVKMLMRSQMNQDAITTGCSIYLCFSFATKDKKKWGQPKTTRVDLDNACKSICDAGNSIVWQDDALIWFLAARKVWAETDHVRLEVSVEELEPPLVSRKVIAASDLMFKKLDAKIAKSPKLKKIYEKAKKEAEVSCAANETISGEDYLRRAT